jgi:hypothetical protein
MREEKATNRNDKPMKQGKAGMASTLFLLAFLTIVAGRFYLYQVNDLATKGYEIRDIENRIAQLEKDGKNLQIKEVELRSMYNLEKATQDLNLVNAQNVSYLEMDNSVAMK